MRVLDNLPRSRGSRGRNTTAIKPKTGFTMFGAVGCIGVDWLPARLESIVEPLTNLSHCNRVNTKGFEQELF